MPSSLKDATKPGKNGLLKQVLRFHAYPLYTHLRSPLNSILEWLHFGSCKIDPVASQTVLLLPQKQNIRKKNLVADHRPWTRARLLPSSFGMHASSPKLVLLVLYWLTSFMSPLVRLYSWNVLGIYAKVDTCDWLEHSTHWW